MRLCPNSFIILVVTLRTGRRRCNFLLRGFLEPTCSANRISGICKDHCWIVVHAHLSPIVFLKYNRFVGATSTVQKHVVIFVIFQFGVVLLPPSTTLSLWVMGRRHIHTWQLNGGLERMTPRASSEREELLDVHDRCRWNGRNEIWSFLDSHQTMVGVHPWCGIQLV